MFLKPFPSTFSSVVLSLHLQMDTNFFVSLASKLSLNQLSQNGENPDQLIDYTKRKRLVIVHMRQVCKFNSRDNLLEAIN